MQRWMGYKPKLVKKRKMAKARSVKNIPISITRKVEEINLMLPKILESGNFAGGYQGSTMYSYVVLDKPIEIKNQYVYIHSDNRGDSYTFEKRYNVNNTDSRKELLYDLGIIKKAFTKLLKEDGVMSRGGKLDGDTKHTYMMLGRLQMDNDYFLGAGGRSEKQLWANNVPDQIKEMKKLWNSLPKDSKPEWLSMQDIENYEKEMKNSNVSTTYEAGGGVNTRVDTLKKGDTISIEFGSSFSKYNKVNLKVRSRNKVKKDAINKITFENVEKPNTVRYYAYKIDGGFWRFAKGDSAISIISLVDCFAEGGEIENHSDIVNLIEDSNTYMTLYDEDEKDLIMYSTRENGNVGEELASDKDIDEAIRLKRIVESKFNNVVVEVEVVDEWVHLNIRPIQKATYKYHFHKHSTPSINSSGFTETYDTMNEMIKKRGTFVGGVNWEKVKKELENIIEYPNNKFTGWYDSEPILISKPSDNGNDWGYFFSVSKSENKNEYSKGGSTYAEGGGIGSRFELGTPVNYITEDYSGNERIESGEVVSRNGKKAISLYKDMNYSGDGERIIFFDEIDMGKVKKFSDHTYAEGGEINDYNFGYVIKDEDGDIIHESVFLHVGKNEADAKNKAKKYLEENKFDIIDGLEMGLEEDEVSIEIVNAYAEGGEIKDQLVRVLKDSGFNNIKGKPLNEYTHNRGHIVAVVTRDSVHLSNYTPNTHRFLGSTSFDNPKKLAEYFDKNQTYAKGGSTYAEGGAIKLYDVVVYWEDEDEESGDKEFTGIVADSEEQAEKIAKGLMEEDFYGMEVTEPSITYASVTERDSTYAEGGGIKGNYFEGELSFLNW
jgi:hypothetical protein